MHDEHLGFFLIDIIEEDTRIALENLGEENSPYNRRIFVKTFYTYLEGLFYRFRQETLKKEELTIPEKTILSEERYVINGKCEIVKQDAFLTFEQSFKLSLRYYFGKIYDTANVNFGDGGWQALKDGLTIRNRITHPRYTNQINVSDKELAIVKKAKSWVDKLIADLFEDLRQDNLRKREEIQRQRTEAEESTKISNARSLTIRRMHQLLKGAQIKHNIVYIIGNFEDVGVLGQFNKSWMHEGKNCLVVDDSDGIYNDIIFPVFFSKDYD